MFVKKSLFILVSFFFLTKSAPSYYWANNPYTSQHNNPPRKKRLLFSISLTFSNSPFLYNIVKRTRFTLDLPYSYFTILFPFGLSLSSARKHNRKKASSLIHENKSANICNKMVRYWMMNRIIIKCTYSQHTHTPLWTE